MSLEVITGCMFSGKTEELIRKLTRQRIAGRNVVLFKPKIDNRYSEKEVVAHSGISFEAIQVINSEHLYSHLDDGKKGYEVIGIDEVQFFDDGVIDFCVRYGIEVGRILIVSGLNMNSKGEPFKFKDSDKHMGDLIVRANFISLLTAVCDFKDDSDRMCGDDAHYSKRFSNDQESQVVVGGKTLYRPRCLKHFHYDEGRSPK
jgi:thymidine kinase